MKVLFLDVDGVLNNEKFFVTQTVNYEKDFLGVNMTDLDLNCLKRLARIVKETGCKIVVSSVWRMGSDSLSALQEQLDLVGVEVYSTTPVKFGDAARSVEINMWLDKQEQVTRFAILDDDADADVGHSFFRTSFKDGLTEEITDKVIHHLKLSVPKVPSPCVTCGKATFGVYCKECVKEQEKKDKLPWSHRRAGGREFNR